MRPIATEDSDITLVLGNDTTGKSDLPAQRCALVNETSGLSSAGFESTWEPDQGERRALANGAPLLLNLWGTQHPPVSLEVGEPPAEANLIAQYSHDTVIRAFAIFMRRLSRQVLLTAQMPSRPQDVTHMAEESLKEAAVHAMGGVKES